MLDGDIGVACEEVNRSRGPERKAEDPAETEMLGIFRSLSPQGLYSVSLAVDGSPQGVRLYASFLRVCSFPQLPPALEQV